MYIKECKWCGKTIEVEKQCLFALHVSNCDFNPNKEIRLKAYSERLKGREKVERITLKQNCPKCGEEFEVRITESQYKRNKFKKYCSIKCANGKNWTDEQKKNISESCKKSEKVWTTNKKIGEKRKLESKKDYEFICLFCGEKGTDIYYNKNRKYHNECWRKISGGIREGSSRGKCGWYKGFWCDSSYELAYVIYCLDNNISIERNKKFFNYEYKNKKHKYYPDFRVNGELVEIKNYESELTKAKLKSVDENITIYYKTTIKPFLEYAINTYGKKFIELYEYKNANMVE